MNISDKELEEQWLFEQEEKIAKEYLQQIADEEEWFEEQLNLQEEIEL